MGKPDLVALAAAALFLLAACTSSLDARRLQSDSREKDVFGIPYALTKPTFVLKKKGPSEKAPGTSYELEVVHVPDPDHLYSLNINSPLFANVSLETKFAKSGALSHVNSDVDDGVVDTIKSIGEFVAQAIGVAADVAKSQATGGATTLMEKVANEPEAFDGRTSAEVVFPHTDREAFEQFLRRLEEAAKNGDAGLDNQAQHALRQVRNRWRSFTGTNVRDRFVILPDEQSQLIPVGLTLLEQRRAAAAGATLPTDMTPDERSALPLKYEVLLKKLTAYRTSLKARSSPTPESFAAFRKDVTAEQRLLLIALQGEFWSGRVATIATDLPRATTFSQLEDLRQRFELLTKASKAGVFADLWSIKRLIARVSTGLKRLHGKPTDDAVRGTTSRYVEQLAKELAGLGGYVDGRWPRLFQSAARSASVEEKQFLQLLLSNASRLANLDLEHSIVDQLVDGSRPQWQFAYLKILEKKIARLRRELVVGGQTQPSQELSKLQARRAFLLDASNEHARARMLRKQLSKVPATRSSSVRGISRSPAYDQYAKAREELVHVEKVIAQKRSSLSTAARPKAASGKPKDETTFPIVLHGGRSLPKSGKRLGARWVEQQVAKRYRSGSKPPEFVIVMTRGPRNTVDVLDDTADNKKEAKQ